MFNGRLLQLIFSDISNSQEDEYPDNFDEVLCLVGKNDVIFRSSNKKLKLSFPKKKKKKIGIQSNIHCET